MQDVLTRLETMRRPPLLLQAARIAAAEYRRERTLPRFFGLAALPRPAEALVQLIEIEGWHDDGRRAGDAAYSVIRHVEAMTALLGEAQILHEARAAQLAGA